MMSFSKLHFSTCNLLDWAAALNSENIRLAESRMDSGWMPWEPQIRADYHHSMFLVEVPIKQGDTGNKLKLSNKMFEYRGDYDLWASALRGEGAQVVDKLSFIFGPESCFRLTTENILAWYRCRRHQWLVQYLARVLPFSLDWIWETPSVEICLLLNYHPWILTAGYPKWWFGKWFSGFNLNVAIFGINSLNFWGVSPFFYVGA